MQALRVVQTELDVVDDLVLARAVPALAKLLVGALVVVGAVDAAEDAAATEKGEDEREARKG